MDRSEQEHVEMIKHPDKWPFWPVLPVKKTDGSMKIGVLWEQMERGKPSFYVFFPDQNVFNFDAKKDHYVVEDIEKFVQEGWRVD